MTERLIIVSNRLPITVRQKGGRLEFGKSSGGLVTAVEAYLERSRAQGGLEALWVGWPGADVDPKFHGDLKSRALEGHQAWPVLIPEEKMDRFYFGFCNGTLWPLFHYMPSLARYEEENWRTYREVNTLFAEAVLAILKPGDRIWVHDYQLMLLPGMIREKAPSHPIGFFLHIPFPSFEIFRLLPFQWRKELLEGILAADLAGFHTQDYTQYFIRCVFRTLGHDHDLGNILLEHRICRAETFPLGIDYRKFEEEIRSPACRQEAREIRKSLAERTAVCSVDRLDYTKGILHRLRAFAHFLETNPDWRGKVVFLLIVVPSRAEIEQYQRMKQQIDEEVGRINGTFGRVGWSPISYQYRSVSFPYLVALYGESDVALITPLRDGMNLVAKEYVACRTDGTGVLILGEMAGAAREMGEAILVNPNHQSELSAAILQALTMPRPEQVQRNRIMQSRLKRYDVFRWTQTFLGALDDVKSFECRLRTRILGREGEAHAAARFKSASRRLVLLDYDGTLVPFATHPMLAGPDAGLLSLLSDLSADPRTHVYIVSGRERAVLDPWFERAGVGLIAEHGAWLREPGGKWAPLKPMQAAWKPRLLPILQMYADRLPESFLEEKEYSIAWHYRRAAPEQGRLHAKELVDEIVSFTANFDVQVLEGKKVVEIRNAGVNKGNAATHLLERLSPDFTIAIGDDLTDEDMFKILGGKAFTLKVGSGSSFAAYSVASSNAVRGLLRSFLD